MTCAPGLPRLHVAMALAAAALSLVRPDPFRPPGLALARSGAGAPDPAGWRPCRPQSGGGARYSRRPLAAAPGVHRTRPAADAAAARRHRPHDADAALLPAMATARSPSSTAWAKPQLGLLATVLAYDDARGAPVRNAPYAGYQRLDAGETVIIVDTGAAARPALSVDAHAGCLSFEMSVGPPADRRQLRRAGPGRARRCGGSPARRPRIRR